MAEITRLQYLVRISNKYGLDTQKFMSCFVEAWTQKKSLSLYKGISILCRQKTAEDGVFLLTRDESVIAQIRLSETTLRYLPAIDFASLPSDKSPSARRTEKREPVDMKIKDLSLGAKWVNLRAKVVEKSNTRTVFSRMGNPLGVSTATISDNTGSVKLPLWNAQISTVSVGDTVQIENGRVKRFRGELQVSVGRKGRLVVVENR
jgi:replication factor A1